MASSFKFTTDCFNSDLLKQTIAFLEKDELINSNFLSVLLTPRESTPQLSFLQLNDQIVFAGIQTAKEKGLIISTGTEEAAKIFALNFSNNHPNLTRAVGPNEAISIFSRIYSDCSSKKHTILTNVRFFVLEKINPLINRSHGKTRIATTSDFDLVKNWHREFDDDAHRAGKRTEEELNSLVTNGIKKEMIFIFDDGSKPISLAANMRGTKDLGFIAPVYTPKEYRGKGYASAIVTDLSQMILNKFKKPALFTDLSNPTSNSIYQKIGFKAVSDFKEIKFE